VGDPGELLLTLQILDAFSAPGGHGAPPDGNLDHADDQHESRRDERTDSPGESWAGTGEPWEDDDCSCCGDDCNHAARCADQCQSQLRRHSSRNGGLRGGPVRSDLPRRVLIPAHARSIRPWGRLSYERWKSRPAVLSQAGAQLSWTSERADTHFVCERYGQELGLTHLANPLHRMQRVQSAWNVCEVGGFQARPGSRAAVLDEGASRHAFRLRASEEGSGSEAPILASGASNQTLREQLQT
jgi:hypothetical protein